jgi:hypothetical protein
MRAALITAALLAIAHPAVVGGATADRQNDAIAQTDRSPLDLGQEHYEAGRYAEAYAQFARLADCGQREAARLALQMRRHGRKLYGMDFAASAEQLDRWRATLNGSAHAARGCTPSEHQSDYWRHQGVG